MFKRNTYVDEVANTVLTMGLKRDFCNFVDIRFLFAAVEIISIMYTSNFVATLKTFKSIKLFDCRES